MNLKDIKLTLPGKTYTVLSGVDNVIKFSNGGVKNGISPVDYTWVNSSTLYYAVSDCKPGDAFFVSGTMGTNTDYRLWTFADANGVILSCCDISVSGEYMVIVAPPNAAKVSFNKRRTGAYVDSPTLACTKTESLILDKTVSDEIKVLAIGNSVTQDALFYAPYIVNAIAPGVRLTLGLSYLSGSTIAGYISRFENSTADLWYQVKKADEKTWYKESGKTIYQILSAEKWDVIILQSQAVEQESSGYLSKVPTLYNYVAKNAGHGVKIGWISPPVRPESETETSYSGIVTNAQQLMNIYPFSFFIPVVTANQNAKGTSLNNYGVYGKMSYDGKHMQDGIGRLVNAYTSALSILDVIGHPYNGIIGENTIRPDADWLTSINIPNTHGSPVGITDDNCLIAQKCAVMAIKRPFEVSTIY